MRYGIQHAASLMAAPNLAPLVDVLLVLLALVITALPMAQVCLDVSVYGMPYWYKLLHRDSLPQNASRRFSSCSLSKSSSHAWIRMGRFSLLMRIASAMPVSSPKLGRHTMMPSRSSAWARNRAAHFAASS